MKYGLTWTRVHHPLVWRESADALLENAGVRLFLHAVVTGTLMDGDRVAAPARGPSRGRWRSAPASRSTPAAMPDVAAMAGLATFVGANGRVQNPTMIFRLGGVDVPRFLAAYGDDTIMPMEVTAAIIAANTAHRHALPRAKIWLFPTTLPGELLCNCTRVMGRDGRELMTLLADDLTEAEIAGRLQVREYARFFKETLAGCEQAMSSIPGRRSASGKRDRSRAGGS